MALKDTLTAVQYYTAQDAYYYTVDNRPLQDLASNDVTIANAVDLRPVPASGTFTPTINGSTSGTVTGLGTLVGTYLRTGKIVNFQIKISLTSKNAITGNISIGGLPFASSNASVDLDWPITIYQSNVTTGTQGIIGIIENNTSIIALYKQTSAAASTFVTDTDLTNASLLILSGFYITDAP